MPRLTHRTAIVHDWFQGFHGSERVVDAMRTELFAPSSPPDVFTFQAERTLIPPELAARIVQESRLARLPGLRQRGFSPGHWRLLLPYMPYYFAHLPLNDYDVVISSSHAFASHVRPRPDARHVVYCHTPIRYVWLDDAERRRVHGLRRLALDALGSRLRRLDRAAAQRADAYVANSTAVRDRIRSFYGRDATVVPPPVDVAAFDPTKPREGDRFLWVHRLVSYKRPQIVAEAFRGLPYTLTMVGVGPLERELRAELPPNVELLSWLDRPQLIDRFERAAGFLHVGEEDFGISMVEALAAGAPVIAVDKGGARDIVRHGVDGVLLPKVTIEAIRSAVTHVADNRFDPAALAERAAAFSYAAFGERLLRVIEAVGD